MADFYKAQLEFIGDHPTLPGQEICHYTVYGRAMPDQRAAILDALMLMLTGSDDVREGRWRNSKRVDLKIGMSRAATNLQFRQIATIEWAAVPNREPTVTVKP